MAATAPKRPKTEPRVVRRHYESEMLNYSVYAVEDFDDDKENMAPANNIANIDQLQQLSPIARTNLNKYSALSAKIGFTPLPGVCDIRNYNASLTSATPSVGTWSPQYCITNQSLVNCPMRDRTPSTDHPHTGRSPRQGRDQILHESAASSECKKIVAELPAKRDVTQCLSDMDKYRLIRTPHKPPMNCPDIHPPHAQQKGPVKADHALVTIKPTLNKPDDQIEIRRRVKDRLPAKMLLPELLPLPHSKRRRPECDTQVEQKRLQKRRAVVTNVTAAVENNSRSGAKLAEGLSNEILKTSTTSQGTVGDNVIDAVIEVTEPEVTSTDSRSVSLDLHGEHNCKIESAATGNLSLLVIENEPISGISAETMPSRESESESETSETRVMFSPPRCLPYGTVDTYVLKSSPTRLPKHTSDTMLYKTTCRGMAQHFSSTSALHNENEIPRCSTPEFVRETNCPPKSRSRRQSVTTPKIKRSRLFQNEQTDTKPRNTDSSGEEGRGRPAKRVKRRQSFSDRMESFQSLAKTTFGNIKKAVSLDRARRRSNGDTDTSSDISPNSTPKTSRSQTPRRTPSWSASIKRLRDKSSEKIKNCSPFRSVIPSTPTSCFAGITRSSPSSESTCTPRNFRTIGKLMGINQDGSQTILLERPKDRALGFYLSRDMAPAKHGIFVSRLTDNYPESFFAGLIGVGDEIVEVDNISTSHLDLVEVSDLMARKNLVLLRVIPHLTRRDSPRSH